MRMHLGIACLATLTAAGTVVGGTHSVARQWNDEMLDAIRVDFARPTVHARNLYHVSVAMWDAWAAYDESADGVMFTENATASNIAAARDEAISYAAFRVLMARFASSPGADQSVASFIARMNALGYDPDFKGTLGSSPAAVGNRVAITVLFNGLNDNANEQNGYANQYYEPINPPLLPDFEGNPDLIDPDRWQPLALEWFKDQGGNIKIGGYPAFLSPEWGQVTPFSLKPEEANIYQRDGFDYWVYHDPGPPPQLGQDDYYKWGFELVSTWSSHLDPADGVMWDISPASLGNAPLPDPGDYELYYDRINGGVLTDTGYKVNPVTGQPYTPQIVPRGDYTRVLAEFWADGPDSETPPGHWFTIANYVSDHPATVKQFGGEGPVLDDLEWDVKLYLALGGAMHDVAVQCWGTKGWYDFIRPISAIRHLADNGQCSDDQLPNFDVDGIHLIPGLIELVTNQTTMPGGIHEHLAGEEGKIAVLAWRGHIIDDPETETAGVGWILAGNWWPYQRPTFVTPPFAGYTSGHSTYSRTAARLMSLFTGSDFFPAGLGEFFCPMNEFLVFEDGPSVNMSLQWAKYVDASDQTSLSRIWGGIHPPADDIPGRHVGEIIGPEAFCHARRHYNGQFSCASDTDGDGSVGTSDLLNVLDGWGGDACTSDVDQDDSIGTADLLQVIADWGGCP